MSAPIFKLFFSCEGFKCASGEKRFKCRCFKQKYVFHNIFRVVDTVAWTVIFEESFDAEFSRLPRAVQSALTARTRLLAEFGPFLGRPRVDTLKMSKHANMKELRFDAADGAWRAAFAFDPDQQAVLLVAADKSGGNEARFYRRLIALADRRFDDHLARLRKED